MSKKYIFITGGASGMGKSTVQLFIDKGWFVGCYDINKNNHREGFCSWSNSHDVYMKYHDGEY